MALVGKVVGVGTDVGVGKVVGVGQDVGVIQILTNTQIHKLKVKNKVFCLVSHFTHYLYQG